MIRHRLLPFALVVAALLAVVAVAAHGRPLGSGHGRSAGLPLAFWDYAFTTLVIVEILLAIGGLAALVFFRRDPEQRKPYGNRTARALVVLLVMTTLLTFVARHIDIYRLFHPHGATPTTGQAHAAGKGKTKPGHPQAAPARGPQIRWEEIAVVLGSLLVLGVVTARRSRLRLPAARPEVAPAMLAAALDESLDDLRAEPDLRRAIVAAYARMEETLAAAGLPRRPAEAPLEYLERTLLSLHTSAGAVRRLTDLFEWARFSHHEPEPRMRDEAVDALVAVRDELRAAEPVAA